VSGRARDAHARVGRLDTPHGAIQTPAFLPVGTHAAVRGLTPAELGEAGVQGLLANTYHVYLRPGDELVERLGGLHGFMGWPGPILTDSGGFQLYSLDHLCRRNEDAIEFRSPVDGSAHRLTPEDCIRVQERLGADLIVTLDEFEPIDGVPDAQAEARVRAMMERTLRWARRCIDAHARPDQLLFGIVQGGGSKELRAESATRTAEIGFGAFAIGGLGVGEPAALRSALLDAALQPLPEAAPRYLMGLGAPDDVVEAVAAGVDLFDCVIPTRHGRHGAAFTRRGPVQLRNARFREEPGPIDTDCDCRVCATFSAAYLRHLLTANEMLGPRLVSYHNVAFYMRLLADVRAAIAEDRFGAWREAWRRSYSGASGDGSGGPSDATASAA
jgi:queuine tRNA-ribosyltransferase